MKLKNIVKKYSSRIRESDPPLQLGKLTYYRCTNPARKEKSMKKTLYDVYYNSFSEKSKQFFGVLHQGWNYLHQHVIILNSSLGEPDYLKEENQ